MSLKQPIGEGSAPARMADERLKNFRMMSGNMPQSAETSQLLHEVMVHQVELETQNEELIEARAELEENAALLAELYDFAPVGYFSVSDKGLIRQLNLMGAGMLGRERAILLGRNFADFVAAGDRQTVERFMSRVATGNDPEPCEVTLTRNGQSATIVRLTGALSPNGMVCRLAAMDVTEQRRVKAAVQDKNEDLDRIFNLSHDLLGIAGSDGRFRRVNPAFERILGHGWKTSFGCDFLELVHPDDREATAQQRARLQAGEEVMDYVNRFQCADGSYRWLEWRVTPYGDGLMCTVARDITERKEAQDALCRSERKFRSIVESSPTALYLYRLEDDDRLVLIDANPAADKELGIENAPLIGKTLEEAFPKLADTEVPAMYRAIARGELGSRQFEIRYDHAGIS